MQFLVRFNTPRGGAHHFASGQHWLCSPNAHVKTRMAQFDVVNTLIAARHVAWVKGERGITLEY